MTNTYTLTIINNETLNGIDTTHEVVASELNGYIKLHCNRAMSVKQQSTLVSIGSLQHNGFAINIPSIVGSKMNTGSILDSDFNKYM